MCSFIIIVDFVSVCKCIRIVVSQLYNNLITDHKHLCREVRLTSASNECPRYDTKPSDSQDPVLEF